MHKEFHSIAQDECWFFFFSFWRDWCWWKKGRKTRLNLAKFFLWVLPKRSSLARNRSFPPNKTELCDSLEDGNGISDFYILLPGLFEMRERKKLFSLSPNISRDSLLRAKVDFFSLTRRFQLLIPKVMFVFKTSPPPYRCSLIDRESMSKNVNGICPARTFFGLAASDGDSTIAPLEKWETLFIRSESAKVVRNVKRNYLYSGNSLRGCHSFAGTLGSLLTILDLWLFPTADMQRRIQFAFVLLHLLLAVRAAPIEEVRHWLRANLTIAQSVFQFEGPNPEEIGSFGHHASIIISTLAATFRWTLSRRHGSSTGRKRSECLSFLHNSNRRMSSNC